MKITKIEQTEPSFQPFTLELLVESRHEAQSLYAIFNKSSNARVLRGAQDIKYAIGEEYWVDCPTDIIANGVTYKEFYNQC